ncbi:MAG: DUF3035 domain-containing protein [Proteobacteria bacterium]|nr:DUF3035 domain-containing protein [Pseudomonadota bacterium]
MTKTARVVLCIVAAALVGGCADVRKVFSRTKSPPDEFAVYSRAPLSMPPDYGLRPPAPGQTRPQEVVPRNQAETAIRGGQKGGAGAQGAPGSQPAMSSGTQALLRATGANQADPDIRTLVNRESSSLVEEDVTLADRILFWKKSGETGKGTIVDPAKEAKRIRENQALGRSLTEGDTPTIERERGVKGLFN